MGKQKTIESKQHATRKPMCQWRNQTKYKNTMTHMKIKCNFPNSIGYCKSISKREAYKDRNLPQGTRKISSKQPRPQLKRIRKRTRIKVNRRKEIIKLRGNKDQKKNHIKGQWNQETSF